MIPLLRRLCGLDSDQEPLGRRGEQAASKWLARRGYKVVDQNLALGDDEVDLLAIAPDGTTVVIVEVKTRRSAEPRPEASVGRTKQYRLARCAARLQKQAKYQGRPFRFDVIAVVWPEGAEPDVHHWAAAFESPF